MISDKFMCYPVRALSEDDNGAPSNITKCALEHAEWIGVYRNDGEPDSEQWQFDLNVPRGSMAVRKMVLAQGQALCEILNRIPAEDGLKDAAIRILFE